MLICFHIFCSFQTPTDTPNNNNGYYRANVYNPNVERVTLRWYYRGKEYTQEIEGRKTTLFSFETSGFKSPLKIQATYSNSGNQGINQGVQINSQDSFQLSPIPRGGQVPKLYIAHLGNVYVIINNRLGVDCTLSWIYQKNQRTLEKFIAANTSNHPILVDAKQGDIVFTAKSKQRMLAVNTQDNFTVNPTSTSNSRAGAQQQRGGVYNIDIGSLQFYYTINADNLELYPVRLAWDLYGKRNSQIIQGRQTQRVVIADNEASKPLHPIYFSAYQYSRSKPLYLNNNRTYTASPTTDKDKSQTVYISGKRVMQGFVYIDLAISNNVKDNVLMKWSTGDSKFVPKGARNHMLRLPFPTDQLQSLIQFTSYTVDTNTKLAMNRKESLYLKPTEDNTVYHVEINPIGWFISSFFTLLILLFFQYL